MNFLITLVFALLVADPASAAPVVWVIAAVSGTYGVVTAVVVRFGLAIAASALTRALAKRRTAPPPPGIRTQGTTSGDTTSQSFIVGRYATDGNLVAPEMTHGTSGDTPNAYLTLVIDVGDMPISGFVGAIVDGHKVFFDGPVHPEYGAEATGYFAGKLWAKFYDGTQTVADPMLLDKYGTAAERPWTTEMIGRGVPYIIYTCLFDREIWQNKPTIRNIVEGIKLYDVRKDTSVGGAGSHRWGNSATYEYTRNPIVMTYNVARGITLPDGRIYGGGYSHDELPLTVWAAAMNICDQDFNNQETYIAGFEIRVGEDSPLDVIDTLNAAASADVADLGGVMHIRAGGPGLPVAFITDGDILRSQPQELDPFPNLKDTHNGIRATYPSPGELWEARDAPMRSDAAALAEDGEELIADINLPAVTRGNQAQRLMAAWLKDERRFRRHNITLPPDGLLVNPMDTISWSSTRNGYESKLFDVGMTGTTPRTLVTGLSVREVDPNDYSFAIADLLPISAPSVTPVVILPQAVPGFGLQGVQIADATGTPRRPGLKMVWSGNLSDVRAIRFTLRVKLTGEIVASGSTHDVESGSWIISEGILPSVEYEARAMLVVNRPKAWTNWVAATTPAIFLGAADIGDGEIGYTQIGAIVAQDIASAVNDADLAVSTANAISNEVDASTATAIAAADQAVIDAQAARDTTITTKDAAITATSSAVTLTESARDAANQAVLDSEAARDTTLSIKDAAITATENTLLSAESARDAALASENAAGTSQSSAAGSATSSAASAAAATSSAVEAGNSATSASADRVAAETAMSDAAAARDISVTSKTAAESAASSALISSNLAAASESNAATSATASSDSATIAATKASEASVDAQAAETSNLAAITSAGEASVSKDAAAQSAIASQDGATTASASAIDARKIEISTRKQLMGTGAISERVCLYTAAYMVAAEEDSTDIYRNGVLFLSLDRGQSINTGTLALGDRLTSSKPFNASSTDNQGISGIQLVSVNHAGSLFGITRTRSMDTDALEITVYPVSSGSYRYSVNEIGVSDLSTAVWVSMTAKTPFVISISAGQVTGSKATIMLQSDVPILVMANSPTSTSKDADLVWPVAERVVALNNAVAFTVSGDAVIKEGAFFRTNNLTDFIYATNVGDGAGGDAHFSLPYAAMGDEYIIPYEDLTDYTLAADRDVTINVTDKNGVIVGSHEILGLTSTDTTSVGPQSGAGAVISGDGPFYFSGTGPFFLRANENQDEYVCIGYKKELRGLAAYGGADAIVENIAVASQLATDAGTSATAAEQSKVAAETAEGAASVSASAAAASETNSAGSASTAGQQATLAAGSKDAAAISASAAATSATAAATSETSAGQSAVAADQAKLDASTSAGNAFVSETAAATSETNAAGSAATSATQAGLAATSATEAGNSATAASDSASVATTKASDASTSATAAEQSKVAAETAEGAASVSASNSATSATDAETSANSALATQS